VAESDAGLDMQSARIGTTMELRLVHAIEQAAIDFAPGPAIEYSYDSTHDCSFLSPCRRASIRS
jgi:hypothetical protein